MSKQITSDYVIEFHYAPNRPAIFIGMHSHTIWVKYSKQYPPNQVTGMDYRAL